MIGMLKTYGLLLAQGAVIGIVVTGIVRTTHIIGPKGSFPAHTY